MMTKNEMLDLIRKADKAYYENSNPVMTDAEYDMLRQQFISTYGSTELDYVPSDVSSDNADFIHPHEVISLGKVKAGDNEALLGWLNKKSSPETGAIPFLPVRLQKKEDGCTVVTYVINGKVTIVSRGDGKKGKVLTNIPAKYDIPMDIEWPIRSEAIFTKTDYEAIQKERLSQGLEPFKNIRNAVSGVLQSKEKSPYLDRVTFVAYDLMGSPFNVDEQLEYIKSHTPYDVVETVSCSSAKETADILPKLFEKWDSEDHPIDGVVVKSNVRNGLELFGTTSHHPLHSFAFKYFQTGVATILRSVEWQVGREKITAVAHFDPVEIDGTTVEKASVANMGVIREKGLSIGAKILVVKSNQIIPFVEKVLEPGDTPITAPARCPVCGEPLMERNDVLFCSNDACKGRFIQNVDYLASKEVLNMKGLSEKIIERLEHAGKVSSVFDIFELTKDDFLELDGFKEKSAQNLVTAIQNGRKDVDLAHYIAACCVPHIGLNVGEILMTEFSTYEALLDAMNNGYDFTKLNGIGEVMNGLLHSDGFKKAYKALHNHITPVVHEIASASGSSYTFVITGKLSQPRSYFEDLIKSAGSKVTGSVSKNTDYLLCEDENSQSTKAVKARSLGIKVISENQLPEILGTGLKQATVSEKVSTPVKEDPILLEEPNQETTKVDESGQIMLFC